MSDELRRRLARAAGDGDLVSAQQLAALLERETGARRERVVFVAKDAAGSFIWSTVARSAAESDALYFYKHMRGTRRPDATVKVVRIRVYEDPQPLKNTHESTYQSAANQSSLPMASPTASNSSDEPTRP